MGADKEVFLHGGIPPAVMCDKVSHHQDKSFPLRLLPRVDVPRLDV